MAPCSRGPDNRVFRVLVSTGIALIAVGTILSETRSVERTGDVAAPPAFVHPRLEPQRADPLPAIEARLRPGPDTARRPRRAAVLVGVDNAPGADPLPGSRADARTMRDALVLYGFDPGDIIMLLDGDATRARVLRAIDELAATSTDESISVLSFAAHSYPSANGATMRLWDGRVSAAEIAQHVGRLRGRVWSTFATCYAGAYAVGGITGERRIAIFSSSASSTSLQLGNAGSFTVLYVARYAMIDGKADDSVESAFRYARDHIALADPGQIPRMDDRIAGELVLGEPNRPDEAKQRPEDDAPAAPSRAEPTPEPSPRPAAIRVTPNGDQPRPRVVLDRRVATPQPAVPEESPEDDAVDAVSGVIRIL